jgi:hypothetical protein
MPSPLSSSRHLSKKLLLAFREIIDIFGLSMWSTSSLILKLPTFAIRNKMFMDPKMNHYSWNWFESMHNIINLSTAINDTKGRNIRRFASKWGSKWKQCHLTYNWNMNALIAPKDFIARGKTYKILIVILHTKQRAFIKIS